jgi:hypothetical protein
MVNLPGTLPQIFAFAVRDPAVAASIDHGAAGGDPLRAAQGRAGELLRRHRVLLTGVQPVQQPLP